MQGVTDQTIPGEKWEFDASVTAAWNEEMLRNTGFVEVDCFWRWMNFAGWVATK